MHVYVCVTSWGFASFAGLPFIGAVVDELNPRWVFFIVGMLTFLACAGFASTMWYNHGRTPTALAHAVERHPDGGYNSDAIVVDAPAPSSGAVQVGITVTPTLDAAASSTPDIQSAPMPSASMPAASQASECVPPPQQQLQQQHGALKPSGKRPLAHLLKEVLSSPAAVTVLLCILSCVFTASFMFGNYGTLSQLLVP